MKKLQPLRWYGGKVRQAKWICSLLPWRKESTYVEPFGGMMNVLLNRKPVRTEIYNDLNQNVHRWWETVQRQPEEFDHHVWTTPLSESVHQWACETVDDESMSRLDRALAFHVIADQSIATDVKSPVFRACYASEASYRWKSGRILDLAARIWNVQLLNRPAEKILERMADVKDAVIYADPPYYTARTDAYETVQLDVDQLSALFTAQQCQVAISGYNDEWDHLDWQRHEKQFVKTSQPGANLTATEVLWTNYDAHTMNKIGGLFATENAE